MEKRNPPPSGEDIHQDPSERKWGAQSCLAPCKDNESDFIASGLRALGTFQLLLHVLE